MLSSISFRIKVFFSQPNTSIQRYYEENFVEKTPLMFQTFLNSIVHGQWEQLVEAFFALDSHLSSFEQWLANIEVHRRPESHVLIRNYVNPNDPCVYNGSTVFEKPQWLPDFTHNPLAFHVTAVHYIFNTVQRYCEYYDFNWWCLNKYDMLRHIIHLQKLYILHVPPVHDVHF